MESKWAVEFKKSALKDLKKFDKPIQKKIIHFLEKLISDYKTPRDIGAALQGEYAGLWRYRVGDYRLLCEIQDHKLVVLVLEAGHRREIYH